MRKSRCRERLVMQLGTLQESFLLSLSPEGFVSTFNFCFFHNPGYERGDPRLSLTHVLHRRANGEHDVTMKILYCGIWHSDLHIIKNEHGITSYPIVPGYVFDS